MFNFFANIFGYVLNILYTIVHNYGLTMIIFTIIIKLITLPLSIKQQKSMIKNAEIQDQIKTLNFKYKNNPEKLNQEMLRIYKENKISPFSGCLMSILQIILLLSVFYMVRSPLTYMKKMPSEDVEAMKKQVVSEEMATQNLPYPEIDIIRNVENIKKIEIKEAENQETETAEATEAKEPEGDLDLNKIIKEKNFTITNEENKDQIAEKVATYNNNVENTLELKRNMNFLGLDLSKIPQQNMNDYTVYIIPILYIISTFISMRLSVKMQEKMQKRPSKKDTDPVVVEKEGEEVEEKKEEDNSMEAMMQTNKMMSWMMPLISVTIAFVAPLGLALYWLVSNIAMIAERIVLDKVIKTEEE